jgi:hypothetical protein
MRRWSFIALTATRLLKSRRARRILWEGFHYDSASGKYQLTICAKGFREEIVPLEISKRVRPGFKLTLKVGENINTIRITKPQ